MVTIINKTKHLRTYELECSIPKHKAKKSDVKLGKKKNSKVVKGARKETERVLTMLSGERRNNLPDAILESRSIKLAIEKREIMVKKQKVMAAKEVKPLNKSTNKNAGTNK